MSHRPDTHAARIARRHALKLIGSAGAKVAVAAGLAGSMIPGSASAKPGNGRGWAWGWGKGKGQGDPNCLLAGTLVRTPTGDVPVETLRIGDLVVTADRGAVPVKWVGRQSFRRSAGRPWLADVTPVLIRAHAIAPDMPQRDLFLSRSHAVLVAAHLVPADLLVNGNSITSVAIEDCDRLDYFNVEVSGHEVIFAEGLPVETFFGHSRETFSNFAEYRRLYGEDQPAMARHPAAYDSAAALKGLALTLAAPLLGTEDPIRRVHRRIAERASTARG
jgi:hypothetical protein